MKLLCVGVATSLDRYLWLPEVSVGQVNRPSRVLELAGGKVFNAARAAHGLGIDVRVVAQVGGHSGRRVRALAERDAIPARLVDGAGETRQCTCLLDETTGAVTEVYEPVPPRGPNDDATMSTAVHESIEALSAGDVLAISGRVPGPGPAGLFTAWVMRARERGLTVVVDSAGPALTAALTAGPHIVKVNSAEAAEALGHPPRTAEPVDPAQLAQRLSERTGHVAVVTAGAEGAYACAGASALALHPPEIEHASPAGSGDSFLAGIVAGLTGDPWTGVDLGQLLLDGVAASRVNVRHFVAGAVTRQEWLAERATLRAGVQPTVYAMPGG